MSRIGSKTGAVQVRRRVARNINGRRREFIVSALAENELTAVAKVRPGQRSCSHCESTAISTAAAGRRQIIGIALEQDGRHLGIVDNGIDTSALNGERHNVISEGLTAIRARTINHIAFDEAIKRRQAVRIVIRHRLAVDNTDGLHRSCQIAVSVSHR